MSDIFADIKKAFKTAQMIKELSGMSGEFFAALLVANLNEIERYILDGLVKYEEAKKTNSSLPDINAANVGDKAALIGCLIRFRDDLADNTNVGKLCKKKYDEMKAEGTLN